MTETTKDIRPELRIFAVSFLALFVELLVIRYVAVEIRFFTFFKNFALMAAFLGLGLGFGLARIKRDLLPFFVPLTVMLIHASLFAPELGLNVPFIPTGENVFFFWFPKDIAGPASVVVGYVGALLMTILVVLAFVPLGQRMGILFQQVKSQTAYAYDLLGSSAGVVGYTITSFLSLPPTWVVVVALIVSLVMLRSRPKALAIGAAFILVLGAEIWMNGAKPEPSDMFMQDEPPEVSDYTWSPYYRLHTEAYPRPTAEDGSKHTVGYRGFMNGFYYFDLLDFSLADRKGALIYEHPKKPPVPMSAAIRHYSLPYILHGAVKDVLIMGAGPGNDAAAALINGASHVTAVEIDKKVVELGKTLHPLKPYLDDRVEVVVNDARAHLVKEKRKYDLVSFGHLDSVMLLSSFSSIRLDSYVYTVESVTRALEHVRPGGLLSMSFASSRFVTDKIFGLVTKAAGRKPYVFTDQYMGTVTFIVPKDWPNEDKLLARWGTFKGRDNMILDLEMPDEDENPIPTDNWPFLFLKQKKVSPQHVAALALLLALTFLFVRPVFMRKGEARLDWHLFWLGGGFLLVETKSITELSLLFGSTWVVNSVAILGELLMNLAAIAFIERKPSISYATLYGLLLVGIAINFFMPMQLLLAWPVAERLIGAMLVVYSPLFFAGAIFTRSFRARADAAPAFGSNLLGAIVGGSLEYLAVVLGFKLMWVLALGLYIFSAISVRAKLIPKSA